MWADFITAWLPCAQNKLKSFNAQELSNSLWALSVILSFRFIDFKISEILNIKEFFKVFKDRKIGLHSSDCRDHQQIFSFLSYFVKVLNYFKDDLELEKYFENVLRILLDKIKKINQDPQVSKGQKKLFLAIRQKIPSSVKIEEEYFVEDSATFIDIVLPDEKIAIQFDGPSHFKNGSLQRRLPDYLQDQLLLQGGWSLFRFAYVDLNNPKKMDDFLSSIHLNLKSKGFK